jgi:hypothetical protein
MDNVAHPTGQESVAGWQPPVPPLLVPVAVVVWELAVEPVELTPVPVVWPALVADPLVVEFVWFEEQAAMKSVASTALTFNEARIISLYVRGDRPSIAPETELTFDYGVIDPPSEIPFSVRSPCFTHSQPGN